MKHMVILLALACMPAAAQIQNTDLWDYNDIIVEMRDGQVSVWLDFAAIADGDTLIYAEGPHGLAEDEYIVSVEWQAPGPRYIEGQLAGEGWMVFENLPPSEGCGTGDGPRVALVRGTFRVETSYGRRLFLNWLVHQMFPATCEVNRVERSTRDSICPAQIAVPLECLRLLQQRGH